MFLRLPLSLPPQEQQGYEVLIHLSLTGEDGTINIIYGTDMSMLLHLSLPEGMKLITFLECCTVIRQWII